PLVVTKPLSISRVKVCPGCIAELEVVPAVKRRVMREKLAPTVEPLQYIPQDLLLVSMPGERVLALAVDVPVNTPPPPPGWGFDHAGKPVAPLLPLPILSLPALSLAEAEG